MRALSTTAFALLLVGAGCTSTSPKGSVEGYFRLPGSPAVDLQRAGLNFSQESHGPEHGLTVRVAADGRYSVKLPSGSYSVVGALSGRRGGPAPERCAGTMNVVVTAGHTTQATFVCHATPAVKQS